MINLGKLCKSRLTEINHIIENNVENKEHNDMITQENQIAKKPGEDLT